MGDVTTCTFVGDASLNNESFIHSAIFWLLQISIMGQICRLLWTWKNKKGIQLQGASSPDPPQGALPLDPRWGLRPQTPFIGSRSALAMQFELYAVLNWCLKKHSCVAICCSRPESYGKIFSFCSSLWQNMPWRHGNILFSVNLSNSRKCCLDIFTSRHLYSGCMHSSAIMDGPALRVWYVLKHDVTRQTSSHSPGGAAAAATECWWCCVEVFTRYEWRGALRINHS